MCIHEISLTNIDLGTENISVSYKTAEVKSTVTIVNYVLLDENSTVVPQAATNVKVKVKRTITKDHLDILTEVEDGYTARTKMSVDGRTTKIDPRIMEPIESGKVYNMAGQYMGEIENTDCLPKGVYIVNGKKTVIK